MLPDRVNWRLEGHVDHAELLDYYRANRVDLFVSLSASEGLPVSIMEAISFGVPVLAVGVDGVPEIVTASTGRLVESTTLPMTIAAAARRLLDGDGPSRDEIIAFFEANYDAEKNFGDFAEVLHASDATTEPRVTSIRDPHLNVVTELVVEATTREVVTAFRDVGVPHIVLKGPLLRRRLFPEGDDHVSADVDVLVAPDGLAAAPRRRSRSSGSSRCCSTSFPGDRPNHARPYARAGGGPIGRPAPHAARCGGSTRPSSGSVLRAEAEDAMLGDAAVTVLNAARAVAARGAPRRAERRRERAHRSLPRALHRRQRRA